MMAARFFWRTTLACWKSGQPIRALAILYCDIFRGLPAVVTLYLIGFGIPTSGLPEMIVPHVVGWFVDLSSMSVAEQRSLTRIPVIWWCILALTLTYGAYVAEVYRSGIESIHWSQVSAARSLGLSYMQTMRYVVVPQAVRRIIAPLLNDFIGLQKDTALVQVVGVIDAFNQSRIIAVARFFIFGASSSDWRSMALLRSRCARVAPDCETPSLPASMKYRKT